jgi:hypothetical protein
MKKFTDHGDYKVHKAKATKLSEDDRKRAGRMIQEIYVRATELSMILGNYLDIKAVAPVRQLRLTTKPSGNSSNVELGGVEVIVSPETGDCMIYDYDEGVCIPCADS